MSLLSAFDRIEQARMAAARSDVFAVMSHLCALIGSNAHLGRQWLEVAELAAQQQLLDVAATAARRLFAETPPTAANAVLLARALGAVGEAGEAAQVLAPFARGGALAPNDRFFLARLHSFAGAFDEAERLLRELIRLAPDNPFGWELLAQCKTFSAGDPDIAAMETLSKHLRGSSSASRAAINYALGKVYVDVADDERAARALDEANSAQLSAVRFDAASIEAAERAAIEFLESSDADFAGAESSAHAIFVLGPPRSGTSLIEQILGSHSQVGAGGELNFLWLSTREMGEISQASARTYVARIGDRAWRRIGDNYLKLASMRFPSRQRFTDKLLTNHWRAGVIRRALPDAKIVWCRRAPLDVAWSCWRANFARDSIWSCDPDLIARFVASYERVMLALAAQAPDSVIEVEYEKLVFAPQTEIPRLLRGLGLVDEPRTRTPHQSGRAVSTSSFAQVRAPISAASVHAAKRFPIATARLKQALQRNQRPEPSEARADRSASGASRLGGASEVD